MHLGIDSLFSNISAMKFIVLYSGIVLNILHVFSIVLADANYNDAYQIKFVWSHGHKLSDFKMDDSPRLEELSKFKGIKVFVHGFDDSCYSCRFKNISDAYRKHATDQAVICVDWFPLAVKLANVKGIKRRIRDYDQVLKNVPIVGERIAKFFTFLLKQKVLKNLDDVHMIGVSLGAHVVGVAGNRLNGQIGRITGLDPAGLGFSRSKPLAERLDQSDAKYVDIIHTDAGKIGTALVIGHADFFPNGGRSQPKCTRISGTENNSTYINHSHAMASEYFTRSIGNPKYATACKCDSWERYLEKKCVCSPVLFGEYSKPGTSGKYYLDILEAEGDTCFRYGPGRLTLSTFPKI